MITVITLDYACDYALTVRFCFVITIITLFARALYARVTTLAFYKHIHIARAYIRLFFHNKRNNKIISIT